MNVKTGAIHKVRSETTPFKQFQRNPDYIKLYEEAHIEVRLFCQLEHVNIIDAVKKGLHFHVCLKVFLQIIFARY